MGLKINKSQDAAKRLDGGSGAMFDLSRKSYSFHRAVRHFFLTSSTILLLILVYYFMMRFVLHEPLPGGIDTWLQTVIDRSAETK